MPNEPVKNDIDLTNGVPPINLHFSHVLFALCPTGAYCREDRCQSFFEFELIPTMRPPLEECEAAGAIQSLGVRHSIIDGPAEGLSDSEFIEQIRKLNPDLIVLAVTFGSLAADLLWAKQIKNELPHTSIGLRGAPCYVNADEILTDHSIVDLCVYGDYELAFHELLTKGMCDGGGVISRNSDGTIRRNPPLYAEDLDTLPIPVRSQINQNLYTVRGSHKPQATIHVQRGCPFPCTYCLVHAVSGNTARHRSPMSIAIEMRELMDEGITHFYLRAETFTLNKKWAIEVGRTLARECPGAKWVTATRVECVNDEVLSALRAGGCYGISFGVDVASEKIGEKVKKPPPKTHAREAMRLCNKHGIYSLAYFMIGFIWDDEETLRETAQFAYDICPDFLTIHYAHPYPGTPYYEAVKNEGFIFDSLKAQSHPAISLSQLSPKRLRAFTRVFLVKHYLRPSVIWSIVFKIFANIFRDRGVAHLTLESAITNA